MTKCLFSNTGVGSKNCRERIRINHLEYSLRVMMFRSSLNSENNIIATIKIILNPEVVRSDGGLNQPLTMAN